MRRAIVFGLILLSGFAAYGDSVYLKSGKRMNGRIISEDERSIVFEEVLGTIKMRMRIRKEEIAKIEKGTDIKALLARKLAAMDEKDPKAIKAVITWCKGNGELAKAGQLQDKLKDLLVEKWKEANKENLCPLCKGERVDTCSECGGKGKVEQACEACGGAGEKFLDCPMCIINEVTIKRIPEIGRPVVPRDHWIRRSSRTYWGPGAQQGEGEEAAPLEYAKRIVCPKCGGRGKIDVKKTVMALRGFRTRTEEQICPVCRGQTEIVCPKCKGKAGEMIQCKVCRGKGTVVAKCRKCRGSGKQPCPACGGSGLEDPEKEVKVEEP